MVKEGGWLEMEGGARGRVQREKAAREAGWLDSEGG